MNVLVTGAAGWTATSILGRVVRAGHSVIGVDRPDVIADTDERRGVMWLGVDVADDDAVDAAFGHEVDAVIHLAVAVGETDYARPRVPFRTNVLGTYNVLDSARRHGVDRVVVMSSAPVHLTDRSQPANAVLAAAQRASPGFETFAIVGSREGRGQFDVARAERELGIRLEYDGPRES